MASREEIEPGPGGFRRLSYTCRCGWIDWGHALPDGARALNHQIETETTSWPELGQLRLSLAGAPAYVVNYGQSMGRGPITFSTLRHWVVKKGLSRAEREGVALAIFMNATMEFEQLQGTFPFTVVSGGRSSFSIEDVISNVVGFYGALRGISLPRLRQVCGEVTVRESLRIWDEHLAGKLGGLKNRGLTPRRFPCPECDASHSDTSFPSLFSSVQQLPPGRAWVRVKNRFIDGRLVNSRHDLQVSSDGEVSARGAGP